MDEMLSNTTNIDTGSANVELRTLEMSDAPALHQLDYSFETDRIYTLQVRDNLLQPEGQDVPPTRTQLSFELKETPVDLPLYKDYREYARTLEEVETRLSRVDGGYVALADGEVAGAILLSVEEWRSVARIDDLIVGRLYRRYGIGSLLLNCASDWARNRGCWAILLETQNINYPAIQFYLRNGLEVWSINQHYYPRGPVEHEVAIFMGKMLR
ncbi:MAG TPA: GNAT family N-acetyltransferase [Ktedonobacteraceae bacterium]|nr:GNAT family N-acetyltransferase [Ktedonobacteraceae bacterium]